MRDSDHRKLVFIFAGQGSDLEGAGREVAAREPAFARALEDCDRHLRRHLGWSVADELAAGAGRSRLDRIEVAQPVTFALQVASAALWRSWGVEPDAVLGHSLGEVAACCVAGALDLDAAARVVSSQGRALQAVSGDGAMAMVELSPERARQAVAGRADVFVALGNSPASTVLAGKPEALGGLLEELEAQGVYHHRLRVDVAAHCPLIEEPSRRLEVALAGLEPRSSTLPIYSGATADIVAGECFGAGHWRLSLSRPVCFADAVERLWRRGFRDFLEVGPRPILLPAVRQTIPDAGAVLLPPSRRGLSEHRALALGRRELAERGNGGPPSSVAQSPGAPAPATGLRQAAPERRRRLLAAELRRQLAHRLDVPAAELDNGRPLARLGLDSLLALELQHAMEKRCGVAPTLVELLRGPGVDELAASLARRLDAAGEAPSREDALPRPGRRRDGISHPLSPGQRALWFLYRLAPENPAYNVALPLAVRSPLDVEALRRATGELSARHPQLRATFDASGGEPRQTIHRHLPAGFRSEDAAAWSEVALEAALASEAARPFRLESGPPIRFAVFSRGRSEHVLLLVMHHVVSDFWSLSILLRELGALYARATGAAASLPPPPALDYVDFVEWRQRWLESEECRRHEAYWRRRLAGAGEALELPADGRRRPEGTGRGGLETLVVGRAARDRLRALAGSRGATLFTTLLAGFFALLHRYTGRRDLLVGTPTSGRQGADFAGVVGYFVNPVAVRVGLGGDPTFEAFLDRARDAVLDALEHRDYPFPLLVEKLQPRREAGRSPLIQAMFVLEQPARDASSEAASMTASIVGRAGVRSRWAGLELESMRLPVAAAQFDLTLTTAEVESELAAVAHYDRDLFSPTRVRRLLGHFRRLLAAAAAEPGLRLSELPLLSRAERCQLLVEWPSPGAGPAPRGLSLDRLFEARVAHAPDAVALLLPAATGVEALTYRQLDRRAERVACWLRRHRVAPESRVGLCAERGPALVIGLLGILKAGAAYVPLDPAYPLRRLERIAGDAGIRHLLVEERTRARLSAASAQVLSLDRLPAARPARRGRRARPGNAAYVIYTSGSTGAPKGVVVCHAHVERLFRAAARWLDFGAGDVWTLFHSVAFDFSVWELWGALLHGGRLVLVPWTVSRSPDRFRRLLAEQRVSVLNQTPSAFAQLAASDADAGGAGLEALRLIVFGGEALDVAGLRPWFERHGDRRPRLVNMYGITETTVHVTCRPLSRRDAGGASAIGVALPDLDVSVLDRRLSPVPAGHPGQLAVGGAGLARGYLGRPALTAARFVPHPWSRRPGRRLYLSGDLARHRPDGELEYLGRIDRQVKIRGFRIELGEIESALGRHPGVASATVVAATETRRLAAGAGVRRLVAYVVARPAGWAGRDRAGELRRRLRAELPDYMVPSAWVFLERLPLTPQGKADRRALPAPEPEARPSSPRPPSGSVERTLARIWAEVLGLEGVGSEDNFFDLGGDSILSMLIVARAGRQGLELTPGDLFEHQTIAELARAATRRRPLPPAVPARGRCR